MQVPSYGAHAVSPGPCLAPDGKWGLPTESSLCRSLGGLETLSASRLRRLFSPGNRPGLGSLSSRGGPSVPLLPPGCPSLCPLRVPRWRCGGRSGAQRARRGRSVDVGGGAVVLSVARSLRRRPRSGLAATPARIFLRPALLASSLLAPFPGSRSPLLESTGSDTGPWRTPPLASLCPDKGPFPLPASFRSASGPSRYSPDCLAWRRAPGGGPCRRLCGRKRETAGGPARSTC